jgi:hypothetical protein
MRSRYISLLLSVVMMMSVFTSYSYGCEEAPVDYIGKVNVKSENAVLSAYSVASVDDISAKAVYVDTTGNVKVVVFKVDGDIPDNLSVEVGGNAYPVTATPEKNGMVYQNIDGLISNEVGSVDVRFVCGDEQGKTETISTIETVEADEGAWLTSDNGHTLYLYTGNNKDVVVPNFYNGKVVDSIGGYQKEYPETDEYEIVSILQDSSDKVISSCAISEGIVNINPYAFYNVRGFTTFSLPTTLETIGDGAFWNCRELKGDLVIPGSVKTVGYGAFINCVSLKGKLVLEEGVERIDDFAFAGVNANQGFTSLSLPSTLKSIGCYAFQNCTKISSELVLPEGLEIISDGAFDHLSSLSNTKLVIPSTVRVIGGDYNVDENTLYGGHVFYDMGKTSTFTEFEVADGNEYFTAVDGVLYSKDMTRMLAYPRGKRDEVFEIPDGITQLDEMAFSRAAYLKKVVLPDSYEITTDIPDNILNQDGNSLAIALYVYTTVNEIAVKDTNPYYTTEDGILYSKDKSVIWYIPTSYGKDVTVSDKCEVMEKGSIYTLNKSKVEINIPSSVLKINESVMEFLAEYFTGYANVDDSIYYKIDEDGTVTESPWTAGNVNMDEVTDKMDAALILKYVSGLATGDVFNKKAADVDGDGYINITDAINLIKNL